MLAALPETQAAEEPVEWQAPLAGWVALRTLGQEEQPAIPAAWADGPRTLALGARGLAEARCPGAAHPRKGARVRVERAWVA